MNDEKDVDLTLLLRNLEARWWIEVWKIEDGLRLIREFSNKEIIQMRKTKTIREIAEKTGISRGSIFRICGKSNKKDADKQRNFEISELRSKGLSLSQISKETGLSRVRISRISRGISR